MVIDGITWARPKGLGRDSYWGSEIGKIVCSTRHGGATNDWFYHPEGINVALGAFRTVKDAMRNAALIRNSYVSINSL